MWMRRLKPNPGLEADMAELDRIVRRLANRSLLWPK